MRLFILATSQLAIPNSIIHAKIMDILSSCAHCKEAQPIIVGDDFSESQLYDYQGIEGVTTLSFKEARHFIKQVSNAIVLHFGTELDGSKSFPNFFVPIAVPNVINGVSVMKRFFIKRQFKQCLQKSTAILCTNDWVLESLQAKYPEMSLKLLPVYLPTIPPTHFEWQELSAAKELISDGNNYFLAFAPVERFTAILKEFSIFKKWQLTTMHLVFIFDTQKQVNTALEQLKGYKYKTSISIRLADDLNLAWLAATYAILWEGVDCSKSVWVEYAIQYDIPLLFDTQVGLPATWLQAGEVFSFSEKQALSNHFKLYYKDEVYRQSRASMGKDWLAQLNEQRVTLDLFNKIVLSLNK